MSLITVSSLTKSFGAMDLFTNISFTVAKGSRLALVGPNGVGKTTLLRIIVGADEASSGEVHRARGARIGYLPQEADFEMSRHAVGRVLACVLRLDCASGRIAQA